MVKTKALNNSELNFLFNNSPVTSLRFFYYVVTKKSIYAANSTIKFMSSKSIGEKCELLAMKFLKGKKCNDGYCDIITKNCLVEVKSCSPSRKSKKSTNAFGRFRINTENHIMLLLQAMKQNKKPIYFFILRLKHQNVTRIVEAKEIPINALLKVNNFKWTVIF